MDLSTFSAGYLARTLLQRLAEGATLDDETTQRIRKAIVSSNDIETLSSQSTPEEELAEEQRRIAIDILTAYRCFNIEDALQMDKIFEHRTSDCVQVTLPRSAGTPDRNNKQYRKYLQDLVLNDLAPFKGEIDIVQPIISDPSARIAVAKVHGQVHAEGRPTRHDHTVWFLYFTEDRDKVWKIEVWVDSKKACEFREQLDEWRKRTTGSSAGSGKRMGAQSEESK
ncbi:hypothetical protein AC578_4726 [Pseudocercospora eumusae]|uniref:SnoaL-like domain-containing protein n=1 Tax=Pseudocercospora eumusae TaxID=321146 RepID=A0A139GZ77_9PEZI|nr:hypothetical protein AC578_4726 [Pseudocercospora eumusae]